MGSTIWCDFCKEPFKETGHRRVLTVEITPEGSYEGTAFRLDAHPQCADDAVKELRELYESHTGNTIPRS